MTSKGIDHGIMAEGSAPKAQENESCKPLQYTTRPVRRGMVALLHWNVWALATLDGFMISQSLVTGTLWSRTRTSIIRERKMKGCVPDIW